MSDRTIGSRFWIDWKLVWSVIGGVVILALLTILIWFGAWVRHVDRHELGFSYDRMTGQIEILKRYGWWIRTPIRYSVHTIDMRPYQTTLSANQRILNAKLVRFDPKGLETFVEWHGRNAGDNLPNLLEILKCYAFDRAEGRDCPFLEVVSEIAPSQGVLNFKPRFEKEEAVKKE